MVQQLSLDFRYIYLLFTLSLFVSVTGHCLTLNLRLNLRFLQKHGKFECYRGVRKDIWFCMIAIVDVYLSLSMDSEKHFVLNDFF